MAEMLLTSTGGVSILDPGQVPEIRSVNRYYSVIALEETRHQVPLRFPGHDQTRLGDSKIPTVIYYDRRGAVRAVGAEAHREGISETALDEGWTKAEWYAWHSASRCPSTNPS
jgi:hypothetical protein